MLKTPKKIVGIILGTRPEAIKCAPLIQAIAKSDKLTPLVLSTAQHRDLIDPILSDFGIAPDETLSTGSPTHTLCGLSARLIQEVGNYLERNQNRFSAILVQGDTNTTFISGLAAFYNKVPVGHVEAGLRTHDIMNPFPEEANRSMLSRITKWHFAPTELAASRLVDEGIKSETIHVVGNTVADALHHFEVTTNQPDADNEYRILVTCHRRESWGGPLLQILSGVKKILAENPNVRIVFPVHPNPLVRDPVHDQLGSHPRVQCLPPVDYRTFNSLLRSANLVLTDSGGVHEESTFLCKQVVLLRTQTERTEGLIDPARQLAGSDPALISKLVSELIHNPFSAENLLSRQAAFGTAGASDRIVSILERELVPSPRPNEIRQLRTGDEVNLNPLTVKEFNFPPENR